MNAYSMYKNLLTGAPLTSEAVQAMIDRWQGYGILYGTQRVDAPDPINSQRDFAVMLAHNECSLSDELAALLPPPDDIPDDAVA